MANSITSGIISILQMGIEQCGSASALSRLTGVSTANISRWMKQDRSPRLAEIEPILEALGVTLNIPNSSVPTGDVHFANVQQSPSAPESNCVNAEDYIAIPVLQELQARPGPISPMDVQHYMLVLRSYQTIRYKRDLIAVIKDKSVNSQEPLIRGGDIVIVDRDDCQPHAGDFMLVSYPKARGLLGAHGAVCRVQDNGDTLVFYSDDKSTAPSIFSIDKDYGGDPRRAILGKVLFCWSDMQGK